MKKIAKIWYFRSDSNPKNEYETILYVDNTISCGCAGWCRRTDEDGNRTCKHVRYIQSGRADEKCIKSKTIGETIDTKIELQVTKKQPAKPGLGNRKIILD